jgi:hypothetical protein
VNKSEVFVDAEVNKFVNGGSFLGAGLSLWEITLSDTFTPAWMLHFGIALGTHRHTRCTSSARGVCSLTTSMTCRTTTSSGAVCGFTSSRTSRDSGRSTRESPAVQ